MAQPLADLNARIVVGHRGDRAHAPENTLESLTQAVTLGADALEFDVRATRDGIAVLMHDATVDRTTNGRGAVRENTFAELRLLDASRGCPAWAGGKVGIPTLEEVLDRFRDVPLILDVKEMAVAATVEQMLHKFGRQGSVVLGSADSSVMTRIYRSGFAATASAADATALMAMAMIGATPTAPDYAVLSVTPNLKGFPIPVMRMIACARRAHVATHVWTVNDPAEAAKYWAAGATAIITDDPGAILRAKPK
jgi:glycerophosphoryl diester phosphodiesterase